MAPRGISNRIADELRIRIRGGVIAPGSLLPSESHLSEQHGAARGIETFPS